MADNMFMTRAEAKSQLEQVRMWALDCIHEGGEPPWAQYQYMKLVETVDAIIDGLNTVTLVDLPQLATQSDTALRCVVDNTPQGIVPRPRAATPTRLPM